MTSDRPAHEHVQRRRSGEVADKAGVDTATSENAGGGIAAALLRLQGAAGNAATTRLIQTKLMVGSDSDPLEREADRIAARVVAGDLAPDSGSGAQHVSSAAAAASRATRADADTDHDVVGLEGGAAPAAAEEAIARAGAGRPLPEEIQRSMEEVTGADLSDVRVHTGPASDAAAQHLQARAFTIGKDIHFAAGEYEPSSKAGKELLAHEATHTVQQNGGAAASRKVVQRMPSPAAVKTRTGRDRNEGKKIFGKVLGATTSYNELLDAIKAHSDYITSTEIAKEVREGMAQVATISRLVDAVVAAAQKYLSKDKPDPSIAALCGDLIADAGLEKRIAADVLGHWLRNAHGITNLGNPKWFVQLPDDPKTYKFKASDTRGEKVTATGGEGGKGANKEVKQVEKSTGEKGYFAEDDITGAYSDDEKFGNATWMLDLYGVKGDVRLGNRSIAMSRLDKLLNGGVIARTERGLLEDKVGTFQYAAEGEKWADAAKKGRSFDDANLPRLLSRLQLIDAIAGQVDRHAGNYFIQFDESGKVTGVTGIDLDMAWGHDDEETRNKFDVGERVDKYPGFSRFVDKEMAERIIGLDPDDLRAVLVDLLEPEAIEAAVRRLKKLQDLLQDGKTQLLEPRQWDQQIRAGLMKEDTGPKSYFGREMGFMG